MYAATMEAVACPGEATAASTMSRSYWLGLALSGREC
jgi:hypothetical protein